VLTDRSINADLETADSSPGKQQAGLDVRRLRTRLNRVVAFVLALALATALRAAISPIVGYHAPFATYYLAVMFTAWYIGWWPAAAMLGLGGLLGLCFFVEPASSVFRASHAVGLAQYGVVGVVAIVLVELLTKSLSQVRQREELLLRSEERVSHLARVATIGELSASIAHELNQPLAAILSNAEAGRLLLAAADPPLEKVREILDDICKDDARAGDVIGRMRAMLPRHSFHSVHLDVAKLIAEAVRLVGPLARQRRVTVRVECDGRLPRVLGDPRQLEQVLLNLAINGMDAMQDCPENRRLLRISAGGADKGRIKIQVGDCGHGVPDQCLPSLFKPFHTTKPDGMGMGLSIARTLIEAHGGKIWLEANSARGATFALLLPPAEGDAK
jgi:signal transduction histidine kinase